ncbi:Protein involved in initiation of plasmid replication [Tritonibacter multivorans]|uniref:Protein involved in initiation of plasmid replication n=1 Tax=Tritonibacter multivorans TaxID=928856 RepID=A0A0P1G3Y6_9RHOB|nr:replication initiation protein [Tritonibacter multivorans]MDA7421947.1 replication initiation protein [Tritonibacter multivorans]CUH76528.1 Protein involved in initiation of plasmid replication [Tritonibacter multivorans]SFD46717.1 Initiator Replication protein [Tritonibacter multivorans]
MPDQGTEIDRDRLTGALTRETVKKNVAAIHISGKLTLLQRKLSNVLLLNAYDTLTTAREHTIDARTLAMMVGYNSNDFDTLRASLKTLAETVAEWDMLDEQGHQEWGVSALLSYAKLKNGICEYAYSPALAAKLHDPKIYALINVHIQRNFSSGHGLALYENCYRFVRTGSTGWWSLEIFRKLMGVDGSDYYQSYKHLNAKIIKPAVAEVNKSSDIIVEPEIRKKGRSVSDIRFLIRENPQMAMFQIDDSEGMRNLPVYKALRGQGVSDRLARQWITEHGSEYVQEKLDYVASQDGVKSRLGYLQAAIKGDYTPVESEPRMTPEQQAQVDATLTARAVEQAQEAAAFEARAIERRNRARQLDIVQDLVSRRNPTQRDADKRLFMTSLESDLDREHFRQHGWRSALNAAGIISFWQELEPDAFAD